jgi:hypothetical protein
VRGDASVEGTDSVTLELPTSPGLEVVKTATLDDENEDGAANQGERITYSFAVTNTGNVTMRDVEVKDDKVSGIERVGTLAPGQSVTVSADPYVVSAADARAGSIVNVATVLGRDPSGEILESEKSEVMTVSAEIDDESTGESDDASDEDSLPGTGAKLGPELWFTGAALVLSGLIVLSAAGARRREESDES